MQNHSKRETPLKLTTANRKNLPTVKEKLRQKVAKLDLTELRRIRFPFHEALLTELRESRHKNAHDLFREMVDQDLEGSKILTKDKQLMERIFEDLKQAEFSKKEDEIGILTALCGHISKTNAKLGWLVEKIYKRALKNIKVYQLEETLHDATVQFFYGKFLSETRAKYEEAVSYLSASYNISFGVDEWMVELESGNLNVLVAEQLCKSLLKLSEKSRKEDPERAFELSTEALKIIRSHKSEDNLKLEAAVEMELGSCCMALNRIEQAFLHFELALELTKMSDQHQGAIAAMMKMAECFESTEDDKNYDRILNQAKEYAEVYSLTSSKGEILVMLGKFWTQRDDCKKAAELLDQAVEIFDKIGDKKKLQHARLLVAVPKGNYYEDHFQSQSLLKSNFPAQETFDDLVETILKSDKGTRGNNSHLARLLLWYDRKSSITNRYRDPIDSSNFVKQYLDPDEVTLVDDSA